MRSRSKSFAVEKSKHALAHEQRRLVAKRSSGIRRLNGEPQDMRGALTGTDLLVERKRHDGKLQVVRFYGIGELGERPWGKPVILSHR